MNRGNLRLIEGGRDRNAGAAEAESRKAYRDAEHNVIAMAAETHLELLQARKHCLKLKRELHEPHVPAQFHNWIVTNQVRCLQDAYEQLGSLLDCFTEESRRTEVRQ